MSQANLHGSAPTQFRAIGDVRLAYRQFGQEGAPPLVCLQHFTGTMDNWDPIHTNRLAQDRPVVLVDYRGVGRSSGETPDSMQGMGRDIIAFIRVLGAKQVDIFGFSIGGMVAQQIALDAPELVRRLILAGTGPSGGEAWLHSRRRCRRSLIGRTARQPNGCWSCFSHRPAQARPRARRGLPASQRGTRIANRLHRPRSPPPSWPR
jgi:pimeloyl-ACP methyl ester carboxylesterase